MMRAVQTNPHCLDAGATLHPAPEPRPTLAPVTVDSRLDLVCVEVDWQPRSSVNSHR